MEHGVYRFSRQKYGNYKTLVGSFYQKYFTTPVVLLSVLITQQLLCEF